MPKSGPCEKICFQCRAIDGRIVRLTKKRYDDHILPEHPDLARDFAYPASEIQKAVEAGDTVEPGANPDTQIYVGPVITPNRIDDRFSFARRPRRMEVVIQKEENNRGFVTTAYAPIARAKGGVR